MRPSIVAYVHCIHKILLEIRNEARNEGRQERKKEVGRGAYYASVRTSIFLIGQPPRSALIAWTLSSRVTFNCKLEHCTALRFPQGGCKRNQYALVSDTVLPTGRLTLQNPDHADFIDANPLFTNHLMPYSHNDLLFIMILFFIKPDQYNRWIKN